MKAMVCVRCDPEEDNTVVECPCFDEDKKECVVGYKSERVYDEKYNNLGILNISMDCIITNIKITNVGDFVPEEIEI